ncbi:hypothetical protein DIPPA_07191 [Diplonema papillatum]|nr:hypothetical protein DIPPA_07191 [Diplonema papillatum]
MGSNGGLVILLASGLAVSAMEYYECDGTGTTINCTGACTVVRPLAFGTDCGQVVCADDAPCWVYNFAFVSGVSFNVTCPSSAPCYFQCDGVCSGGLPPQAVCAGTQCPGTRQDAIPSPYCAVDDLDLGNATIDAASSNGACTPGSNLKPGEYCVAEEAGRPCESAFCQAGGGVPRWASKTVECPACLGQASAAFSPPFVQCANGTVCDGCCGAGNDVRCPVGQYLCANQGVRYCGSFCTPALCETEAPATGAPPTSTPRTIAPLTVAPPTVAPPTPSGAAAPSTEAPPTVGKAAISKALYVASIGASPTAGKLAVLKNLNCEVQDIDLTDAEPLDWELHPMGFPLGNTQQRYYLGAVVGNATILLAIVALQLAASLFFRCRDGGSFFEAGASVRYPSLAFIPLLFLYQGTTLAAVNLVYRPGNGDGLSTTVGYLALAGSGWIPFALYWYLLRPEVFAANTVEDPGLFEHPHNEPADGLLYQPLHDATPTAPPQNAMHSLESSDSSTSKGAIPLVDACASAFPEAVAAGSSLSEEEASPHIPSSVLLRTYPANPKKSAVWSKSSDHSPQRTPTDTLGSFLLPQSSSLRASEAASSRSVRPTKLPSSQHARRNPRSLSPTPSAECLSIIRSPSFTSGTQSLHSSTRGSRSDFAGDALHGEFFEEKPADLVRKFRWLYCWVFGSRVWAAKSARETPFFVEKFGLFFESYREGKQLFVIVELASILLLSLVAGFRPASAAACNTRNAAVVALLLAFLTVTVKVRPFLAPLDNAIGIALAAMMAVAVLLMSLAIGLNNDPPSVAELFFTVSTHLLVASAVIVFLKALSDFFVLLSDMVSYRRERARQIAAAAAAAASEENGESSVHESPGGIPFVELLSPSSGAAAVVSLASGALSPPAEKYPSPTPVSPLLYSPGDSSFVVLSPGGAGDDAHLAFQPMLSTLSGTEGRSPKEVLEVYEESCALASSFAVSTRLLVASAVIVFLKALSDFYLFSYRRERARQIAAAAAAAASEEDGESSVPENPGGIPFVELLSPSSSGAAAAAVVVSLASGALSPPAEKYPSPTPVSPLLYSPGDSSFVVLSPGGAGDDAHLAFQPMLSTLSGTGQSRCSNPLARHKSSTWQRQDMPFDRRQSIPFDCRQSSFGQRESAPLSELSRN